MTPTVALADVRVNVARVTYEYVNNSVYYDGVYFCMVKNKVLAKSIAQPLKELNMILCNLDQADLRIAQQNEYESNSES